MRCKYLQAYLDEFVFRYNRRKTRGVVRIAARTIEGLVSKTARTLRDIVTPIPRPTWLSGDEGIGMLSRRCESLNVVGCSVWDEARPPRYKPLLLHGLTGTLGTAGSVGYQTGSRLGIC